jgi:hypothetical protein
VLGQGDARSPLVPTGVALAHVQSGTENAKDDELAASHAPSLSQQSVFILGYMGGPAVRPDLAGNAASNLARPVQFRPT